ncbi:MAG TPA: pyruvate, water dikinase regulatory protein [Dongiaceae bacterium]|jgi:hypothetical protein|nr:pyruvate, water dikinase regulatory protein [Dongiaceae bacterium]
MTDSHLHLVSDATGETLNGVVRACLAQFVGIQPTEHHWFLIRSVHQMDKVLEGIERRPGLVLYTIVNEALRQRLIEGCARLGTGPVAVLDPAMMALGAYFGQKARGLAGRQHELDAEYFHRIEAMNFALSHDDGQSSWNYDNADVILVGVSRSSKTPTSVYLANRGIKAANVPFVPNCPLPPELFQVKKPLIVGLTKDASQLVHIRKNRLEMISQDSETDYTDPVRVREEVALARRLFNDHHWPIIDVTRRSIEETAATIMQLLERHRGGGDGVTLRHERGD